MIVIVIVVVIGMAEVGMLLLLVEEMRCTVCPYDAGQSSVGEVGVKQVGWTLVLRAGPWIRDTLMYTAVFHWRPALPRLASKHVHTPLGHFLAHNLVRPTPPTRRDGAEAELRRPPGLPRGFVCRHHRRAQVGPIRILQGYHGRQLAEQLL